MRFSVLALAGVAPSLCGASAVRPRFRAADVPANAVVERDPPLITTAPVAPPHLNTHIPYRAARLLDLDRRAAISLPACAKPCIDSAITEDTTCTLSDFACGCQESNALAIETAASLCVYSACGYLTAFDAWETLEDICATYLYTNAYTVAYTVPSDNTDGGKTTVAVTITNGNSGATATSGGDGGSTTTVTAGAGSSGSSGSSGTTSSSKGGLSKGAIAGIAVGAAGGAIILCAVLFLVYRCTKRNNAAAGVGGAVGAGAGAGAAAAASSKPEGGDAGLAAAASIPHAPSPMPAGGAAVPGNAADVSPMSAAAVPVSGQSELDGKASAVATTIGTTPTPPLAPPAASVSPVSAQTAQTPILYDQNGVPLDAAAIAAWQQQQLYQQQQQQYAQQQYAQQYAQQQYVAQYAAAQQQQQQQQPYVVQGYSIAPGQAPQVQTVVSPAGYAAAHPSQPVPGVVYQEAPAGIPQSHYPQELSSQVGSDVASPATQPVVPVATGPSAALPVAPQEVAAASPVPTAATVSAASPETAEAETAHEEPKA